MGLPSKKRSKQQKRERRSHIKLVAASFTPCPKCKKPARPHRICPNCGYYKGRDILQKDLKAERKKKRVKKHEQKSTS